MRVLSVSGKDSEDFLHRVTSGTVKGVAMGEGAGGALLTGQSRLIAQFDLLRLDRSFLLVSPDGCFESLREGLENLHFAEDLTIEPADWQVNTRKGGSGKRDAKFVIGQNLAWPSAVNDYVHYLAKEAAPWPEDYEFDRIGSLLPSLADWDASTPALEAGMLPYIDRFKGCYPGQEVVERSLNVGHPARVLVGFEGNTPLIAGEKIPLDGGGEGQITSVAEKDGIFRALARVPWAKREAAPAGFRALKAEFP